MGDVTVLESPVEPVVRAAPTVAERRFDEIEAELAELCGQRNVIDGRIAELLAEVDREGLLGGTGLRSLEHFATWQLGCSRGRAQDLTAIAARLDDLPLVTGLLREGRLSVDQVAPIARNAPSDPHADQHYADLVPAMTVTQIRKALRSAPKPPDAPARPEPPERQVHTWWDDDDCWNASVRLSKTDGTTAEAALQSHRDALVNEWKAAHANRTGRGGDDVAVPPFPTLADAFVRLLEHGWDADATARPHGHRTTVVLHVDVESKVAELHLGPALTDAERRYLCCDAKVETGFERDGTPLGAGRTTREIPRRLRRALERRARGCCEVPGCSATAGLHAHHLTHWEDGGPTELWNLLLCCPFHHRAHHAGLITIRGPAGRLRVTDRRGRQLNGAGLARPPQGPPVPATPYQHPTGEAFHERWYQPPSLS